MPLLPRYSRRSALRLVVLATVGVALSGCVVGPSQANTARPTVLPPESPTANATAVALPGASPAPAGTGTPSATGLRFMAAGSADELAALARQVDAFVAKNQDTRIAFEPVTADYESKMQAALAAGTGSDVLAVDQTHFGSWQHQGLLGDLSSELGNVKADTAGLYGPLKDFFTVDQSAHGLPYGFSPLVLFINKAAFEAAGQHLPDVSWTWEQFGQAAKALTKGTGGAMQSGFAPSLDPLQWMAWVGAAGASPFNKPLDPVRCTLDTPQAAEGLQAYANLWLKDGGASNPISPPAGAPLQAFTEGKAAMVAGPRAWVAALKSHDRFSWDVAFLPAGPGGHAAPLTVSGFAITKNSKQQAAAAKLLAFLCTTKDAQVDLAKGGTPVPAYRVAAISPEFRQLEPAISHKVFTDALEFGMGPYRSPSWSEATDLMTQELGGVWKGTEPAVEAVKRIAPKVTEVLQRGLGITPTPEPTASVRAGTPGAAGGGTAAPRPRPAR